MSFAATDKSKVETTTVALWELLHILVQYGMLPSVIVIKRVLNGVKGAKYVTFDSTSIYPLVWKNAILPQAWRKRLQLTALQN